MNKRRERQNNRMRVPRKSPIRDEKILRISMGDFWILFQISRCMGKKELGEEVAFC